MESKQQFAKLNIPLNIQRDNRTRRSVVSQSRGWVRESGERKLIIKLGLCGFSRELFLGLLLRGAIARPRCPAKRTQISRRKSGNEEKQAPFSFFSFCLLFSCALLRPIMMIFASELLFAITALHTFAYLLASCGFSAEMGNVEKRDRQLESRADAEERNGWKSELTQIPICFHDSRLISNFAISLRFIFRFSSKLGYQRKVRQPVDEREQENKQQTLFRMCWNL